MAPARPLQALEAGGLLALAALLFVSPPFQLWLGRGSPEATRCFPHHLLPLRLLAEKLSLTATSQPAADLDSALAAYRGWFDGLDKLRSAGLPLEELDASRGRVELHFAQALIRHGRAQIAHWHLLEAARCLGPPDEIEALASLAREQHAWQALAAALARLDAKDPRRAALFPADPASRAELQRWLGQELLARGEATAAQQQWQQCADLGLASCHSFLAALLEARDPGLALQHHLRALQLDGEHWPSLQALHAKEKRQ